jgi:hypothetical protein
VSNSEIHFPKRMQKLMLLQINIESRYNGDKTKFKNYQQGVILKKRFHLLYKLVSQLYQEIFLLLKITFIGNMILIMPKPKLPLNIL